MEDERINICYAISDAKGGYTKIAGTSICSVLENTGQDVTIHILHDGAMTKRNLAYLHELVEKKYDQKMCLYDVSRDYKDIWQKINETIPMLAQSRLSIATFYRLIMGDILSQVKRIIYLDADVIVNMDIYELWSEQTGTSGIAAVPDVFIQKNYHNIIREALVPPKEYFNAGVLLVDLDKFRSVKNLMDRAIDFLKQRSPTYLDQDILNYYFPRSCVLDVKYNTFVNAAHEEKKPVDRRIYHYANNYLGFDVSNEYDALFFKYFCMTPWCNFDFIGNLYKNVDQLKFRMLDFCNLCANKRRIVVALESGKDVICDMLKLGNDETFIPFEHMEDYQTDFNKTEDIFLLAINQDDYYCVKQRLESFGLKENVHFINLMQQLGITDSDMKAYKVFLGC